MMVLSGMNTIEQVLDITSSMSEFKALNEEEYKVIEKVSEIINANTVVPCIACKSCEKACPQHLEISEYRKDVSATFDNGPGLRTK
jgi:predicted aldo/keto reductase-like oxidoreductase